MRWLATAALTLISALPVTMSLAQADTFKFTAIPDEDESRLVERFDKVADYLEEKLGVDVEYVPVKSYSAAVSAFRNDQIQMAWFGGLTGVQARQMVPGSVAIAQGVEDAASGSLARHRQLSVQMHGQPSNQTTGGKGGRMRNISTQPLGAMP